MKGGPQTWDELREKPVSVTKACISLDGTRIAAFFADKTLGIYDTTTGEASFPPFKVDENPRSVIFSRDGKLIVLGDQALRLWNAQTGEEVEGFDIEVYSLPLSPDGTRIAAGCDIERHGWGNDNIRVIDLKLAKISYFHSHTLPSGEESIKQLKGEVPPTLFEGHEHQVNSVAYSPDGWRIASSLDNSTVWVWDVGTGSERRFSGTSSFIRCVAFSRDGTQIAADTGLFNLSTGRCIGDTRRIVNSFAFSADGRFFASGSSRPACRIWDVLTHQIIVQLIGHTGDISSVDFFPDCKHIMSASQDGTIRVWGVELLEERGEIDEWWVEEALGGCWILGPEKERLFWTPLPFQHARNTLVIGRCMKIDFSKFVHGDEWVKCREPLESK